MYPPPMEGLRWLSQPISTARLDNNPHLEGGGGGVGPLRRKGTDNEMGVGWGGQGEMVSERGGESQPDEQGWKEEG